jgi:hypothetical protein
MITKIGEQPSAITPFAFEDNYFTEFSKKPKFKIIETAEYTKKWKKHKVYYKIILLKDEDEEELSECDISDIIRKDLNDMIKTECFNSVIYSAPEKDVNVYIYKNGNHFNKISSMTAFYGQSYYCEKCDKPYQNKDKHKCKKVDKMCIMCFKSKHEEDLAKRAEHQPKANTKQRIYCEKCNRYCFNQECLENHSEVCEKFYKCFNCNKILKRNDWRSQSRGKADDTMADEEGNKEHRCGWEKFRNCHKEVEIQRWNLSNKNKTK